MSVEHGGPADAAGSVRWGRLLPVVAGMTAGAATMMWFLRRQLLALTARAVPYVRRRARVSNPALIINRWSGDGKAEQFGLADAAHEAGIRVIMLERGDDITQLARDAIAAADAIGAAGGDRSLGLVGRGWLIIGTPPEQSEPSLHE